MPSLSCLCTSVVYGPVVSYSFDLTKYSSTIPKMRAIGLTREASLTSCSPESQRDDPNMEGFGDKKRRIPCAETQDVECR